MNKNSIQYTMNSGGANGSDQIFGEYAIKYGIGKINHYWYKKPNPHSKPEDQISEEEYQEGIQMIHRANKTLKRKGIEKYMHLLARNWLQVKNSESIFAIGTINGKQVNGGTGWAVQMGIDEGKSVYVFDQEKCKWYFWNREIEVCNTPILTKNYAGIGTREINENGIKAIENLYKRTFLF